jgi:hypothetical protein
MYFFTLVVVDTIKTRRNQVHFQFLEIIFSSGHQITELSFRTLVPRFESLPGKGWGVKVNHKFLTL